ncbi:heterodisulfide reductase-related iron-sulfur binding cluster [Rhodoferax sp.]|uniref:heterodisulfide reductase-related iron-sulfur binding cluster n=1 Tax=Rhodoferax sp. TaxID=50421 RepID=UPI002850A4C9|nr:heterodisulfide reductase-related iron-sulfur binding cluster [Rhodoferax sp.]MDR3370911.1 heterodisulfide reductase-related iron-sulfur binding cluster [Rhodoferax sp.]
MSDACLPHDTGNRLPDHVAELRARKVIERCASCGHCRDLMDDSSCLFMPQLYRLVDREESGGGAITSTEMKQLLDLCNTCGICPCTPVHTWIREAKDAFVARDGLPANIRLIENVQFMGKLGGALPQFANLALNNGLVSKGLKRVIGIHPERKLPLFPTDGFTAWAQARGLGNMPKTSGRKVAYFAGCTARYYFPQVAKATVDVLERNGVAVYLPEQKCCGMPAMLEGDRAFTFDLARFNVAELARCVTAGFDIVCSCPTCGYLLKSVLREGAQYSKEYRALVQQMACQSQGDFAQVSKRLTAEDAVFTGRANSASANANKPSMLGLTQWKMLSDQGYFAELGGANRLRVANHTYDLGEYLWEMHTAGQLKLELGAVPAHVAYFAPCHQRQQGIGQPWLNLLGLVPQARTERVGDAFDCCGLGGIMGFKKDFHETSLSIGARLTNKIKVVAPEKVATDCLSCRMQFQQMLPYQVFHPVEILRESYRNGLAASPEAHPAPLAQS